MKLDTTPALSRRIKSGLIQFLAFALILPVLQLSFSTPAQAVPTLSPAITIDPDTSATPWSTYSGTPVNVSRVGAGTTDNPYALNFTGNNYITFPSRDFGKQFTVSAWVKPNTTNNINTILSNAGANLATNGFKIEWNSWISNDRRMIVEAGNGGTGGTNYTSGQNVVFGSWQQLTYVVNLAPAGGGAPQVQLYLNGSIQCYAGGIPLGVKTSSPWRIGAMMDPSYFMNASLGKLNVYNSALSQSDVQADYNSTSARYLASPPAPSNGLVPPTNTALPAITGTGVVGTSVSATEGSWNTTNSCPTTYTYQWARGVAGTYTNISGATAARYTATPADAGNALRVIVTAVSASGSTTAIQTINAPAASTTPTAPSGVTATPGNTNATVSWTNTYTGTPAVTGYTVTASPGGATCRTTNIALTSCVVPGLSNNTAYTFTVVATNSSGNSEPSTASTSTTPYGPCSVSTSTSGTNFFTYSISGGLCSWIAPAGLPVTALDVTNIGTGLKIATTPISVGNGQAVTPGSTTFIVTSSATIGYGIPFTLTYNANTATGTLPTAVKTSGNQSVTLNNNSQISPLVKSGYSFAGWNTSANGSGTPYNGGASFAVSANATVYAQWKQFTLNYSSNGATGGFAPAAQTLGGNVTVGTGSLVRTGYFFNGWNTSAAGTGTPYAAGSTLSLLANTTLYAMWSKYSVKFDTNTATSGSVPASLSGSGRVTLPGNTGNLAKANSYWAGWYTNSAGTGGTLYLAGETPTISANTILYAKFSQYKIIYSTPVGETFNGNPVTGSAPSPTLGFGNITTATNSGNFATLGYSFTGWVDGSGRYYAAGATFNLTTNLTLYPYFSQFTLTYDTGTALSGVVPAPSFGAGTVTLASNSGSLAKGNNTFAGWYTNRTGTGGTFYAAGASYTLDANVTLYPTWSQFVISYDMTGSSGGTPFTTSGAGIVRLAETANGYTVAGKSLAGWTTASGAGTFYNPGETFNLSSNVKLYPKWLTPGAAITIANTLTPGSSSVLTALGTPSDTGTTPFNPPSVAILVTEAPGGHSSSPFVIKYSGLNCSISGSANTAMDLSTSGATGALTGFLVTPSAIADCYITITRPADANYAQSVSQTIDFEFYPINQIKALLVDTSTVGTVFVQGTSGTVQVPGTTVGTRIEMSLLGDNIGTGNGAVSYAAYGNNCFMTNVGGTYWLNATTPTSCNVIVTRAAAGQWAIATSQVPARFSFTAYDQNTVAVGSKQGGGSGLVLSIPFLSEVSLFTTGGSGNGGVSYSVFPTQTYAANCSISGNVLTATNTGSCKVVAYKSPSGFYLGQTSIPATFTFTKIAQSPIAIIDDAVGVNEISQNVIHLSISGGSGDGAVRFIASPQSDCTIVAVDSFTATLTSTKTGLCSVFAIKAESTGYLAANSPSVKYFFGSTAEVTLQIVAPVTTASVNTAINLTTVGGNRGAGAGAITFERFGNSNCILSSPNTVNGTISVVSSQTGSCNLQAKQAAGGSFLASASNLVTLSFTGGTQSKLSLSYNPAFESSTATESTSTMHILASGGSGSGKYTYSVQGSNGATGCAVTANDANANGDSSFATLVALTPGTCLVTVVKSGDSSYSFTSSTTSFIFTGILQDPLLLTPDSRTAPSLTNVRLVLTGGSGTGAVSYSVSGTGCSLNSESGNTVKVTASSITTCNITARKASDVMYSSAFTSGASSALVTFGRSSQVTLTLVVDNLTSGFVSSKGADFTYLLTTTGGSGNGLVTFGAFGANCKLETSTVGFAVLSSVFSSATCTVIGYKAADTNLHSATQTASTVLKFVAATQSPLSISADATSAPVNSPINLTTTGGSGSGAYRYVANNSATSNPSCALSTSITDTSTVTGTRVGICSVTVIKSASGVWGAISTTSVSLSFGATQEPLKLDPVSISDSATAGLPMSLKLTGGLGTGVVKFSSGACSVSYNAVTGILTVIAPFPTTCVITAIKAGDDNYFAATSNSMSVTFAAQAQAPLTIDASAPAVNAGETITVTALAGSGTGAYKFALYQKDSGCVIVSWSSDAANNRATAVLSRATQGACSIQAIRAGSGVYGSANSQILNLVWGTIAQKVPLTISNDPTFASVGETITVTTKGGSGTGTVTFTDISYNPDCKLNKTTGQLFRATYGTCTIRATKGADGVYTPQNSQNIVFTFYGTMAQRELSVYAANLTSSLGSSITLSTTGGSSVGAVSYVIVGGTGTGTISGNLLTATSAGTLIVKATKQGDPIYASVVSLPATFTFTP